MNEECISRVLDRLLSARPALRDCKASIEKSFDLIRASFAQNGLLLIAGNGGNAAEADHVAAELVKSFKMPRPLPAEFAASLCDNVLANHLEGALPAISLTCCTAVVTAIGNDIGFDFAVAQQVYALGSANDTLLALSTSGRSSNLLNALKVAHAKGMHTIAITGSGPSPIQDFCMATISLPEESPWDVQESQVAVCHTLCHMLELAFFNEANNAADH